MDVHFSSVFNNEETETTEMSFKEATEKQILAVVFLWKQLHQLPKRLFHKTHMSKNTKVLVLCPPIPTSFMITPVLFMEERQNNFLLSLVLL